jgi:hypothetical protein
MPQSTPSLVQFDSESGPILVEVEPTYTGPVTRGGRSEQAIAQAGASLESMLGRVGPAVKGIVAELREAADWPDEVEVEFAVKLSTDANVIIARTRGEANFRVALKWARPRGGGRDGQ